MSGFGHDDNPFSYIPSDNPFEDPAVQQVTASSTNAQKNLEDYNPFQEPNAFQGVKTVGATQYQNEQPAVMQPTQEIAPPTYTRSAQQAQPQVSGQMTQPGVTQAVLTTAELQRRQEELDRKAEELNRREEEMKTQGQFNVRRNNWPPLPEKCCFQPCFYHDINVEIQQDFQKVVLQLYYVWIFHGCILLLNTVGGVALLFTGDYFTFILSIIYAAIFIPFSFVCWYRPAYKAFRDDSSFNFMVFFFIFLFQTIASIIQTLGIRSYGTCGFLRAIDQFGQGAGKTVLGIFLLVIAAGFAAVAVLDILIMTKIHRIYRSSGASMAKAHQEFTTNIMKSDAVRNLAADAGAAAVRNQFNRY